MNTAKKIRFLLYFILLPHCSHASENMSDDEKKARVQTRATTYGTAEAYETLYFYDGRQITRPIEIVNRQYNHNSNSYVITYANGRTIQSLISHRRIIFNNVNNQTQLSTAHETPIRNNPQLALEMRNNQCCMMN